MMATAGRQCSISGHDWANRRTDIVNEDLVQRTWGGLPNALTIAQHQQPDRAVGDQGIEIRFGQRVGHQLPHLSLENQEISFASRNCLCSADRELYWARIAAIRALNCSL